MSGDTFADDVAARMLTDRGLEADVEMCPDCGDAVDGHDRRAGDGCEGCDACIARKRRPPCPACGFRHAT